MIDEKKTAEILALLRAGMTQGAVARKYRVSQQMVSKVWRRANGFRKGRRGGDRVSDRYRRSVERKQRKERVNDGQGT